MATHEATVAWRRGDGEAFTDNRYARRHEWRFDGGAIVPASSSPYVVRVPLSDPAAVDPEEAFVAALASCHMLFFLSFAAADGWTVERYTDAAQGTIGKREDGRDAMTGVKLAPDIAFAGDAPSQQALAQLHQRAHEACFLANSLNFPVTVAGFGDVH